MGGLQAGDPGGQVQHLCAGRRVRLRAPPVCRAFLPRRLLTLLCPCVCVCVCVSARARVCDVQRDQFRAHHFPVVDLLHLALPALDAVPARGHRRGFHRAPLLLLVHSPMQPAGPVYVAAENLLDPRMRLPVHGAPPLRSVLGHGRRHPDGHLLAHAHGRRRVLCARAFQGRV